MLMNKIHWTASLLDALGPGARPDKNLAGLSVSRTKRKGWNKNYLIGRDDSIKVSFVVPHLVNEV